MKKRKYVWVTLLPMVFVTVTTLAAATQMVVNHYWPKSATPFVVNLNIFLIVVMAGSSIFILLSAFIKWIEPRAE